MLDKIQQLPHLSNGHGIAASYQSRNEVPVLCVTNSGGTRQRPSSSGDVGLCKIRKIKGKLYVPLGLPSPRSKTKRWLSRSAPTTPSGTIPMSLLPEQNDRLSESNVDNQQAVPLLFEQDENENINADLLPLNVSLLTEEEQDRRLT